MCRSAYRHQAIVLTVRVDGFIELQRGVVVVAPEPLPGLATLFSLACLAAPHTSSNLQAANMPFANICLSPTVRRFTFLRPRRSCRVPRSSRGGNTYAGSLRGRRGGSSGREGQVDAGNATTIACATTTPPPPPAEARLFSSLPPPAGCNPRRHRHGNDSQ